MHTAPLVTTFLRGANHLFSMATLKKGAKAPAFNLPDKNGKKHALKDVAADFTVVYFYPKDNTPGCTIEAMTFTKDLPKYKRLKTTIIGISGGDEKTKTKFCEKHKLKVLLLSDTDFSVAKKYKCYGKKKFMGKEYMGIFRNTFVLDNNKKVIGVFENVKPPTHSKEVLDFIKQVKK